ncbi:MAG: hypothetical protein LBU88_01955 [Treponema sp.]|jgi:hypothetical protein|nr:hypothetical protein [Treponema sp.]
MTITQTVEITDSRWLNIKVPREIPTGRTILTFTPVREAEAPETSPSHPCPICASKIDPETGNPRFDAETVASIEEGRAMMRGEIPAKRFNSFEEMWEGLTQEDE